MKQKKMLRSQVSEGSSVLKKTDDVEDLTLHPDASTADQDVLNQVKTVESYYDHVSKTSVVPSEKTLASSGPAE